MDEPTYTQLQYQLDDALKKLESYRKALEDIKHFNRDEGETDLNIILKMWAVAIGALKND